MRFLNFLNISISDLSQEFRFLIEQAAIFVPENYN